MFVFFMYEPVMISIFLNIEVAGGSKWDPRPGSRGVDRGTRNSFAAQAMAFVCYPTSTLEVQTESHDRCSGHCTLRHQLHVTVNRSKATPPWRS